jgi:nitroreductase
MTERVDWARELIASRQNHTPRRLADPGPTEAEMLLLLEAAAAAPDHGQLTPWRFVHVPLVARPALGEAFRSALLERDASATSQQQSDAFDKAFRSPCLLLAVLDLIPREKTIPPLERSISLGCAIQNMLLLAQALGYDSGLSSGQAMNSAALRSTFELNENETAACFVSFGTATKRREPRQRPRPDALLRRLSAHAAKAEF